eukprot:UN08596
MFSSITVGAYQVEACEDADMIENMADTLAPIRLNLRTVLCIPYHASFA